MDLTEFKSAFLEPGRYVATILDYEMVTAKSGTEGVTFFFATADNQESKGTWWLSEKAMYRLAQLAAHCGLTEKEMKAFEYGTLTGKRVGIIVEERDSYCSVEGSYKLDAKDQAPAKPTSAASQPPAVTQPPKGQLFDTPPTTSIDDSEVPS